MNDNNPAPDAESAPIRWGGRYLSAAHRFIPAALRQDAFETARAENVVNAAVMAGTAGPMYALAYWLLGLETAAYEILLCSLVMLSAPLVLRASGSIVAAREVFLCALFFNFSWLTWHLGGIVAPTASWLITGPVVAMFLGGVVSAGFWLAMSCASATLIWLLQASGVAMPAVPPTDMPVLHLVCDLGLYVVVLVFVLLFELSKTEGFSRLRQALATINELAIRDELTGAHNRRFVLDLVEKEKERSDRSGSEFCLCLFDLDHFKRINDSFGHAAGDAVLRAFATAARGQIRACDAFGRYGGEEFLLLLPETPSQDALALAERIRGVVENLRCLVGDGDDMRTITATVSVGVAQYRLGEPVAQTIVRADEALYQAKASGRNRVLRHGADRRGGAAPATTAASATLAPSAPVAAPGAATGAVAGALAPQDHVQRDQLTGLLHRRLLRDRLRHAMERANRNRRPLALLLLNINRFKEINDAFGHELGDALLTQAGGAIRRCLRDCDTVARWGGDEFVALLEDLALEADAHTVAGKILSRFAAPLQVDGRECTVTLAVGMALYPAPGCDVDVLLERADIAMRAARGWGSNIVRQYADGCAELRAGRRLGVNGDPAANTFGDRQALKDGLRDALAGGQLFLEYQPQVELRARRVIGVEALVRWQHPQYGRIEPGRFIALAEENGMIVPIGDWVLRAACSQNRAWHAAGLPEIKTAVNLSARQLKEPGLAARVLAILLETKMPAACLELEITEGVLIDDLGANRAVLERLRAAGVQVSIDDFGTGYSSLNYLCELPLDVLKLDGLFVRRLGADDGRGKAYAIADSVVTMAHRLGLSVIAEAVETVEQLDDLCAMGCDAAQGYLFDRPLTPEQVAALLGRQAREADALPA